VGESKDLKYSLQFQNFDYVKTAEDGGNLLQMIRIYPAYVIEKKK